MGFILPCPTISSDFTYSNCHMRSKIEALRTSPRLIFRNLKADLGQNDPVLISLVKRPAGTVTCTFCVCVCLGFCFADLAPYSLLRKERGRQACPSQSYVFLLALRDWFAGLGAGRTQAHKQVASDCACWLHGYTQKLCSFIWNGHTYTGCIFSNIAKLFTLGPVGAISPWYLWPSVAAMVSMTSVAGAPGPRVPVIGPSETLF